MADLNRVRDPLEIAAASPDPVIRRMAIRRKEIEPEIQRLDHFFATYAEQPESKPGVKAPAAPAEKPARAARKTSREPRVDTFGDTLCAILSQQGPLSQHALFDRYKEANPDDTTRTTESLRVAIAKRSERIGRVSTTDRRYWPVGMPLPVEYVNAPPVA